MDNIKTFSRDIYDILFPVGYILITKNNNYNEILKHGVWEIIGIVRVYNHIIYKRIE